MWEAELAILFSFSLFQRTGNAESATFESWRSAVCLLKGHHPTPLSSKCLQHSPRSRRVRGNLAERGTSSRTHPLHRWDRTVGSRGPGENNLSGKVCRAFLQPAPAPPALRHVGRISIHSRRGVLLPSPTGPQGSGAGVERSAGFMEANSIGSPLQRTGCIGWAVSAGGRTHQRIDCLAHCTEWSGLVLVPSFLGRVEWNFQGEVEGL